MSYDTVIAQLVVNTSDIIPREFVANEAINLVYDNIDFGEDIKKQTHVTNGIITQKIKSENQSRETSATNISKSHRSLKILLFRIMRSLFVSQVVWKSQPTLLKESCVLNRLARISFLSYAKAIYLVTIQIFSRKSRRINCKLPCQKN